MTSQNWELEIGYHQGTMMSRDFTNTTTTWDDQPLQSLEDCIETANKYKESYQSRGVTFGLLMLFHRKVNCIRILCGERIIDNCALHPPLWFAITIRSK